MLISYAESKRRIDGELATPPSFSGRGIYLDGAPNCSLARDVERVSCLWISSARRFSAGDAQVCPHDGRSEPPGSFALSLSPLLAPPGRARKKKKSKPLAAATNLPAPLFFPSPTLLFSFSNLSQPLSTSLPNTRNKTDLTARDAALRFYGRQLASALALGAGIFAAGSSTPGLWARLLPDFFNRPLAAAAGRTVRLELGLLPALSTAALLLALGVLLKAKLRTKTYLLDFACYKPPEECRVPLDVFQQQSRDAGVFDADALDFQTRVSERNGVSDHAYFPPALHDSAESRRARLGDGVSPTTRTMREAREEAQMVLFGTVSELLARLSLSPQDVDVLVVNCSLFNPTPSLSAMLINHFGMRADVTSFNLAGMGCSAGVLAVQLAQKLLQTHKGKGGRGGYALVVSTENVTQNW